MDDDVIHRLGQADFHDKSTLHPVGVSLLLLFGFAMLLVPRRHAMVMILACGSFMAVGQRIVIAGFDFNFMRIMILFGWARLIMRQEYRGFRWNRMDLCFLAMSIVELASSAITGGAAGSVVFRLGMMFESLGTYFMARILLRDLTDVRSLIFGLSIISIPIAIIFLIERSTGRNLFSVFGGVPEFTAVRSGKLRCQGAYSHAILAGCYWAAIFPLIAANFFSKSNGSARLLSVVGMFSSLLVIVCCASSTPLTGVLAGIVGFAMFRLRKQMSLVRWLICATVIVLHFVRNTPVWHLVARVDFVGGSTGYHRAHLVDMLIAHFNEWALFGAKSIDHWTVQGNDVCMQYALVCVRSGVVAFSLFLLLVTMGFGSIGRTWRRVERSPEDALLVWAIGVSLFVHIVNFIGVAYFGQIDILWFIGIAMTSVTPSVRTPVRSVGSTVTSAVHPRARQVSRVLPAGLQ